MKKPVERPHHRFVRERFLDEIKAPRYCVATPHRYNQWRAAQPTISKGRITQLRRAQRRGRISSLDLRSVSKRRSKARARAVLLLARLSS
jgi:hypothetical protein